MLFWPERTPFYREQDRVWGLRFGVWGFAFLEFQGNSGCLTFLECFNHKLTGTAPMVPCTCVVDVPCLSKDLLSFSVMDLWLATDTCLVHHLLGCQKATNTHHRTKLCQIQHSYNYRINSNTNWISRDFWDTRPCPHMSNH